VTTLPALSPEARLVFRSADPHCEASELARIAGGVRDWARALVLAEQAGATPTLWRALHTMRDELPDEAREFLRTRTMLSDFRMQRLSQRLQETVAVFAARGIPVILLKGAAIGALSDPTFRLRPMTDLDLLVRPSDAARAREAVLAAGWMDHPDERLQRLLRDHQHLPPFVDPSLPGLRLEVHRSLFPAEHSFALDDDALWRDSMPCDAPFSGARVLSLPHLFLHLAIHFAWQHSMVFAPWRTLRGVGLVTSLPAWSWEEAVRQAVQARAATSCHWTLRLGSRLGEVAVPADVLQRLAPPTPQWVMRAVERHFIALLVPGEAPISPSSRLTRFLWLAALRPRWSGHRTVTREDHEHRWEREFGLLQPESAARRFGRHASAYRAWWQFFSRTLRG